MLCKQVQNYISSAKGLPFFYVVGDENYLSVLSELKDSEVSVVRMSDFCPKDDKFPSTDDLVDYFRTSDIDYRSNKFVVIGLGEFLALRGSAFADKELNKLKNTTLGNARAILLLRGIQEQARKLINADTRMEEQQRAFISENAASDISIVNIQEDTELIAKKGFKHLLRHLEDGAFGSIHASTILSLDNSLFPVTTLTGAFSVIKLISQNSYLENRFGSEEQWSHLLKDLNNNGKKLSSVFKKYDIDDDRILNNFYETVSGLEYKNWLAFLYLKLNIEGINNPYLRLAIEKTGKIEELKDNLLTLITQFSHTDASFTKLYNARKKLLSDFPDEEIAIFVKANEIDAEESIYRLTDNTQIEKKTAIKWISSYGMTDALEYVYPALNEYLKKYIFKASVMAQELTEYFDEYKRLKVTNRLTVPFMELVKKYAVDISYAQLPTRDNAIKAIANKDKAFLYWIDAMGVEYLSYIVSLARKKGLSIHIDIARSELPTITTINKQFFEQWAGCGKYKEEALDNIKHKEKGGYYFTNDESPIHIPAELKVIETAISTAATELAMHNCQSFIIASDHGASRLAVISKQEVPYETDTKGEHSGRCCKMFEGCDVPYKFEDQNGFIVLSDYGRFKGSRSANVEVHGGASLEEIVVPVITLTLKKQTGVQIAVIKPDAIVADRHEGAVLKLYISDVDYIDDVRLVIKDKEYLSTSEDATHFMFKLEDIKKANAYEANVYDGSDLIGNIKFSVKGKTTINDDFDFD